MAFQISEATRLPYIAVERMEGFINYVQYRLSSVLNRFATRASGLLKTIGWITYVFFNAWQVIGLILYAIRAFETSISAKRASFQKTHIKLFNHSANLELIWLVTWFLNTVLVMIALSKVSSFHGYAVILRKLVRLPSFWSLVALTGVSMAGYPIILAINDHSGLVERPVQVILLAFLNFTQVNHSRNNGTLFAFMKVNVFLLFVNCFIQFVIGSIQFALAVYGIDQETETDLSFHSVFGTIRRLSVVIFCYRIYIFHWEKLFVDNRNILCHHDYFENSCRRCDTIVLTTVKHSCEAEL